VSSRRLRTRALLSLALDTQPHETLAARTLRRVRAGALADARQLFAGHHVEDPAAPDPAFEDDAPGGAVAVDATDHGCARTARAAQQVDGPLGVIAADDGDEPALTGDVERVETE